MYVCYRGNVMVNVHNMFINYLFVYISIPNASDLLN